MGRGKHHEGALVQPIGRHEADAHLYCHSGVCNGNRFAVQDDLARCERGDAEAGSGDRRGSGPDLAVQTDYLARVHLHVDMSESGRSPRRRERPGSVPRSAAASTG